jgi:hypothetical protein
VKAELVNRGLESALAEMEFISLYFYDMLDVMKELVCSLPRRSLKISILAKKMKPITRQALVIHSIRNIFFCYI